MASYVSVPIETDPDALADIAFDYMEVITDGLWTPADGNLDVWIIAAIARMAAELRDVASDVPTAIFRYLGSQIMGIQPLEGQAATARTVWTMRDALGYTIEAGTIVGIRNPDGDLVFFETTEDFTVPSGATSTAPSDIEIAALEEGADANGLTVPFELVDTIDAVAGITVSVSSSGGTDEELDEDYLDRLTNNMRLLAPRPITAEDFGLMARNITGVGRAIGIDLYSPGKNDIQELSHNHTSGTVQLNWNGQVDAGTLTWNATASQLKTALEAFSNIGAGKLLVTGGPWPAPIRVEFTGTLGNANQPPIGVTMNSLAGGSSFSIVTVQDGQAESTNNARTVSVAAMATDGSNLATLTKTAMQLYLTANREVNFVVNILDPTQNLINVTFTGKAKAGYNAVDVRDRAIIALQDYLNPINWGTLDSGDANAWLNKTTINEYDIGTTIMNVQGMDSVSALSFGFQGGSMGTSPITLTGIAPIPVANTLTGTVI